MVSVSERDRLVRLAAARRSLDFARDDGLGGGPSTSVGMTASGELGPPAGELPYPAAGLPPEGANMMSITTGWFGSELLIVQPSAVGSAGPEILRTCNSAGPE